MICSSWSRKHSASNSSTMPHCFTSSTSLVLQAKASDTKAITPEGFGIPTTWPCISVCTDTKEPALRYPAMGYTRSHRKRAPQKTNLSYRSSVAPPARCLPRLANAQQVSRFSPKSPVPRWKPTRWKPYHLSTRWRRITSTQRWRFQCATRRARRKDQSSLSLSSCIRPPSSQPLASWTPAPRSRWRSSCFLPPALRNAYKSRREIHSRFQSHAQRT